MKKIKSFMGKYGFIIASVCFFISYIIDDKGNSTNLVLAIVFFVLALSMKNKN